MGHTQKSFAFVCGLSWQTIGDIERGANRNPNTLTLAKIVQALDVELQSLFWEVE